MQDREKFGSRLGFILISAGCAIGLGNVWRFPFITGKYGGAAFVLVYLVFLVLLGIPLMTMEFSVGRASQKGVATSFQTLQKPGQKWHIFSYFAMAGNYLLMMFYTVVTGWMLKYLVGEAAGHFMGLSGAEVGGYFGGMLENWLPMYLWTVLAIVIGFGICVIGLKKGVEAVTKVMMVCLLVLMLALAIRSVTLAGSAEGLRFYLVPDFKKFTDNGVWNTIYAALGQAFFTLSIGMGSMQIFGSYIGKERRLTGEAIRITILDTSVAIMAGLIIFPACFAFNVAVDAGPSLIFITLPNVFNAMPGGRFWGALFFLFMSFAAVSTVVAVFENIMSFGMDKFNWSRKKAAGINFVALLVLVLPCILGFNVLSSVNPLNLGGILDFEDFIVSNNILPLGALVYLSFCVYKNGWGYKNFLKEADAGIGAKFPSKAKLYFSIVLPAIIVVIFVFGYIDKFFAK